MWSKTHLRHASRRFPVHPSFLLCHVQMGDTWDTRRHPTCTNTFTRMRRTKERSAHNNSMPSDNFYITWVASNVPTTTDTDCFRFQSIYLLYFILLFVSRFCRDGREKRRRWRRRRKLLMKNVKQRKRRRGEQRRPRGEVCDVRRARCNNEKKTRRRTQDDDDDDDDDQRSTVNESNKWPLCCECALCVWVKISFSQSVGTKGRCKKDSLAQLICYVNACVCPATLICCCCRCCCYRCAAVLLFLFFPSYFVFFLRSYVRLVVVYYFMRHLSYFHSHFSSMTFPCANAPRSLMIWDRCAQSTACVTAHRKRDRP